MVPQNKSNSEVERTEAVPAQEKIAAGIDAPLQLSAEQVYAQRLAETSSPETDHALGFIP